MPSLYRLVSLLALSITLTQCQVMETDKATSTTTPRSSSNSTPYDSKTKTKYPGEIVNDMKYEDSTGQQFFDDAGGNKASKEKASDVVVPPKEKEVIKCPDKYAKTCEQDGWSLKCKIKEHSPYQGVCPRVFHTKVVKTMTTNTSGSEQAEVIETHVITVLTTTTETSTPGFIASLVVTETTTVKTDAKGITTTSTEKSSSSSMSATYTHESNQHYHNGVKVSKKGQYEEIGDVAGGLGA